MFSCPVGLYPFQGSQPCCGHGACITQWSYEPCCTGPPKMDGSWWRVLTKHGPLGEEIVAPMLPLVMQFSLAEHWILLDRKCVSLGTNLFATFLCRPLKNGPYVWFFFTALLRYNWNNMYLCKVYNLSFDICLHPGSITTIRIRTISIISKNFFLPLGNPSLFLHAHPHPWQSLICFVTIDEFVVLKVLLKWNQTGGTLFFFFLS